MQKPEPIKPEALRHPKAEKLSKFQGDVIRPKDTQGFDARRKVNGCSVTEGTRPPSNVRPVTNGKKHPGAHAPMTRDLLPTQDPQVLQPVLRPSQPINKAPLTDRQKKMLRKPK